jgi:hypothetical protein
MVCKRRVRCLVIAACATTVSLCLEGCAGPSKSSMESLRHVTAPRPAAINHLAFFKLNDPADAAELIADCDANLATIPGVVAYFCGRHIDTGRGERVDSNYDVGFYVGFMNEADYAAYVDHPRHKQMLVKWQPRWEWIRVQDVQDATP